METMETMETDKNPF